MVVDGHVHVLPAGATGVVLAIPGDPMAGAVEAAELLDVQVQQPARSGVLAALHRPGRLQAGQAVQAVSAQQAGHRALADAQALTDLVTALALAPQPRAGRARTHAHRLRRLAGPQAFVQDAPHQRLSTMVR